MDAIKHLSSSDDPYCIFYGGDGQRVNGGETRDYVAIPDISRSPLSINDPLFQLTPSLGTDSSGQIRFSVFKKDLGFSYGPGTGQFKLRLAPGSLKRTLTFGEKPPRTVQVRTQWSGAFASIRITNTAHSAECRCLATASIKSGHIAVIGSESNPKNGRQLPVLGSPHNHFQTRHYIGYENEILKLQLVTVPDSSAVEKRDWAATVVSTYDATSVKEGEFLVILSSLLIYIEINPAKARSEISVSIDALSRSSGACPNMPANWLE